MNEIVLRTKQATEQRKRDKKEMRISFGCGEIIEIKIGDQSINYVVTSIIITDDATNVMLKSLSLPKIKKNTSIETIQISKNDKNQHLNP